MLMKPNDLTEVFEGDPKLPTEFESVAANANANDSALLVVSSPEQPWFGQLKAHLRAHFEDEKLSRLHEGIPWGDVERAINNAFNEDPEFIRRLMACEATGHAMNVFGEANDEFIWASGWGDYQAVSEDHQHISYDAVGEQQARDSLFNPRGNAVSIVARMMDVSEQEATNYLADSKLHEQLRAVIKIIGWAWVKTDDETRKAGYALYSNSGGINSSYANSCNFAGGSFRVELRVKKA